jgi:hypothetical protein
VTARNVVVSRLIVIVITAETIEAVKTFFVAEAVKTFEPFFVAKTV